jgi:hypothetical protein
MGRIVTQVSVVTIPRIFVVTSGARPRCCKKCEKVCIFQTRNFHLSFLCVETEREAAEQKMISIVSMSDG